MGEEPWTGWWGADPPFRTPVYVLTHYPREPLRLAETVFYFVTDGIEAAPATEAAGGKDVMIGGGANTVQQDLAAGLVDEFWLHIVPVLLGDGERLFAHTGKPAVEQVDAVVAPAVTHLKQRMLNRR